MQWGSEVRLKQIALSSINQFNGSLEKGRLEPDIRFRFSFKTLMHCPLLTGNTGAGVQPVIQLIYSSVEELMRDVLTKKEIFPPLCHR